MAQKAGGIKKSIFVVTRPSTAVSGKAAAMRIMRGGSTVHLSRLCHPLECSTHQPRGGAAAVALHPRRRLGGRGERATCSCASAHAPAECRLLFLHNPSLGGPTHQNTHSHTRACGRGAAATAERPAHRGEMGSDNQYICRHSEATAKGGLRHTYFCSLAVRARQTPPPPRGRVRRQ